MRKSCTNPECPRKNPQTLTSFNKDASKPDGLKSRCGTCLRAYRRSYYSANPEKQYERNTHYITLNPDRRAKTQRNYRRKVKMEQK